MTNIGNPRAASGRPLPVESGPATREWTYDDLVVHLRHWKRLGEGTISQRLRDLRRMAAHPVAAVRMWDGHDALVDSFYAYMKYRETVEGKAPTAVVNDFKAVISLGDFLGIERSRWPKPPPIPRRARELLPSPEQVHSLLHDGYTVRPTKSYENQLIKYLLLVDFLLGLRFPAEPFALRLRDFDPKTHTLIVTEPKKAGSTRRLRITPTWLCCGERRPSLANYLMWRSKVDVGGSDAFFLRPDGQPFKTKTALKMFVDRRVRPRHKWFYLYLGRKWCANARLIEWDHDYGRVADWLGHESLDMTRRTYEHDARIHAEMYGQHWLLRAVMKPASQKRAENGRFGTPDRRDE